MFNRKLLVAVWALVLRTILVDCMMAECTEVIVHFLMTSRSEYCFIRHTGHKHESSSLWA